jgi:MFS family permease
MKNRTNKESITTTVFIASVYAVLIYNFFMMANRSLLGADLSLFINNTSLANILALTFIAFSVILILSLRYSEKINNKGIVTTLIIIVALCSYLVPSFWALEGFMISFIVVGLSIAYLTPMLPKLAAEIVGPEPERSYYKLIYPASVVIWIAISALIFYYIEDELVWKVIYIITGSLTLSGAVMINNP